MYVHFHAGKNENGQSSAETVEIEPKTYADVVRGVQAEDEKDSPPELSKEDKMKLDVKEIERIHESIRQLSKEDENLAQAIPFDTNNPKWSNSPLLEVDSSNFDPSNKSTPLSQEGGNSTSQQMEQPASQV